MAVLRRRLNFVYAADLPLVHRYSQVEENNSFNHFDAFCEYRVYKS